MNPNEIKRRFPRASAGFVAANRDASEKIVVLRETLEEKFARIWKEMGGVELVREFYFHPHRKWRSDFAWLGGNILFEIDGGIWIAGRHNRGAGFAKDIEKLNAATLLNYRVIRLHSGLINQKQLKPIIEYCEKWKIFYEEHGI